MKLDIETNLSMDEWKEAISVLTKHFDDPSKYITYLVIEKQVPLTTNVLEDVKKEEK